MGGHWLVDARLTHIGSDGYVDRGATDLKSLHAPGRLLRRQNMMVKLLLVRRQAPAPTSPTPARRKRRWRSTDARYHTDGQYASADGPFVLRDAEGNITGRVNYYDDHTDNYLQINNQLLVNHRFNERWHMNLTGFTPTATASTKQYKDDAKLLENGFEERYAYRTDANGDFILDDGERIKIRKDLIREKLMRNHFGVG